MSEELLHKTNTGISSELLAAGELARRGFNVTLTFGNTKAIDLLVEKNGKLIPIQVKGIQRTASICWNINLSKVVDENLLFILVNLHADTLSHPEFFILTKDEVKQHFKPTKSGRDYLDYSYVKKLDFQDRWDKILEVNAIASMIEGEEDVSENILHEVPLFWNGYCPESHLKGKTVRMRLNKDDFFESEETGLQIAVLTGVQAIIMNFRGTRKFRATLSYADEIENGEILLITNQRSRFKTVIFYFLKNGYSTFYCVKFSTIH